ncbi:MAG: META domain-containing protein [Xanthomonadales bacterium]|nr:META domain-containing protein [Xanthomonadales bacterium]
MTSLFALGAQAALAQDTTLADTRWQLVSIQSMDDSSATPDEPSQYTLAFNADQSVSIRSDCNSVSGSWGSEGPSRLIFSDLASTLALCGPDSLDEVYRAQFDWVRSYVLRDGNLFLATLADGAIIEFSPLDAPPVVARLMGDDLRLENPEAVQARILDRLFGAYRVHHSLEATDEEIAAYLADMNRALAEDLGDEAESMDDLTEDERAEVKALREGMARSMIEQWKLNRALYEQYGGRVIYQQFGPEPLDAYRQFLEERQAAGDFVFLDPDVEAAFWRYFRDESMHDFFPPDEAKTVFATPPWED